MFQVSKNRLTALGAFALSMIAAPAMAGTISLDMDAATAGIEANRQTQPSTSLNIRVVYVAGASDTQQNFSGALEYDTTKVTVTTATKIGGVVCSFNNAFDVPNNLGRVAITTTNGSGDPLVDAVICNITIAVAAVTPPTSETLEFKDTDVGTFVNGTVDIVAGPTPPTAELGTVVQPGGGAAGGTGTGSVPVNVLTAGANTGGAASLSLNCTIPAGSNSFAVSANGTRTINAPATLGANGSPIGVTCVRGAQSAQATLSCAQTTVPPSTLAPLTASITCPAGGLTPPTISYNPTAGSTISYTGNAGATVNRSVAVTQLTAGQASSSVVVDQCTIASGFTLVGGSPTITISGGTSGQSGAINTSCVVPAAGQANLTGSLVCKETTNTGAGGTATVDRTWTVSCPAAAPVFSSSPSKGSTVNLQGVPGSVLSTGITVTNTGTAPLSFDCGGLEDFTLSNGETDGSLAPGASQTITVGCTAPAAGTQFTETLSCETNDPNSDPATYTLRCSGLVLAIPTMSASGKILLAALLAGVGLLGLGLRRRSTV